MAKARPYYAQGSLSVAHYDRITAADARLAGDADIYAGLTPAASAILELGAGTGRLTADLAGRGFRVTGVDLAAPMLTLAETRVSGLPAEVSARIRLRRGDMTALDLKQAFDLVICPFFTLAHVPAGAAWTNTFTTAANHLCDGGLAAFHLPRLEVMRMPAPPPDRAVLDLPLEAGRRLRLYVRERRFREGINRLDQVLDYVIADAAGRVLERSPERLTYYLADPAPFAAKAGMTLDRPPIDVGGVGDIWVFRK